jgi:hypothetical protein
MAKVSRFVRLVPLALVAALLLVAAPAHAAKRQVPQGFFGTTVDGPMLAAAFPLEKEWGVMTGAGVESGRWAMHWGLMQPYKTMAEVPEAERFRYTDEGGIPTDWTGSDLVIGNLAKRGFRVWPDITFAPAWAARHPGQGNSPPVGTASFVAFAQAAVKRYGPNGTFWTANPSIPKRPIRDWQIWNEPNQAAFYWSDQPFAKDYVALVKASRKAIKALDPKARIVLAATVGDISADRKSAPALQSIYKAGGKGLFDVAAVHPFTYRVTNVMLLLNAYRATLNKNGDKKKPLLITELAWPSAKGKVTKPYGYETTESEQASRVREVMPLLVKQRSKLRLETVIWYTWSTTDTGKGSSFDYAGLRRWTGSKLVSKPAFSAFKSMALKYEGCKTKSRVLGGC